MDPTEPSLEQELDSDISSIRAEIRNLQKRRRYLTSSILGTNYIQNRLKDPSTATYLELELASSTSSTNNKENSGISPLIHAAGKQAESNHHRIAFSATTFPFRDPAPQNSNSKANSDSLLGLRIDVCSRNGRFAKPYYVLLKREPHDSGSGGGGGGGGGEKKMLRVHRHTIPAFISMEKLSGRYLPCPTMEETAEEEMEMKPWKKRRRRQDLGGLVRALRRELVAWRMRVDAVGLLRERLGAASVLSSDGDGSSSEDREGRVPRNLMGIVSLASTALEARYVRIAWEDGRVGRFKISNAGRVERSVVIGDHGRDKAMEDVLTGGDGKVETVLDRLTRHAS